MRTLTVLGCLGLAAMSCGTTGNPPHPAALSIDPIRQDFGSVVIGARSSNVVVTVTNVGDEDTAALAHALSGTGASSFTVVASGCEGAKLAAGASCTLTLRFSPTSIGVDKASLDVTTGVDTVRASVGFSGEGITAPLLTLAPPSPSTFAPTAVGSTSASVAFTVTNTGTSPTGALTTSLGGDHPADFHIVQSTNGCRGVSLNTGRTCTIAIAFTPGTVGTRTASLTVSSETGNSVTTILTGSASTPAFITLTPAGQEFPPVGAGASSSDVTFTVRNTGGSPSGTITPMINGVSALSFTLADNSCTSALAPSSSCTLTLKFTPTSVGVKSASLDVTATPGGSRSSPLTGVGINPAKLDLTGSLGFGDVTVGENVTLTFTVTNNGAAPSGVITSTLSGANAAEFSFLPPGGTDCAVGSVLAGYPGAPAVPSSCTVRVRFAPTTAVGLINFKTGTLNISASPGGSPSLSVTGNGRALVSVSPTTGVFGVAAVGVPPASAPTVTFTLTNNSTIGGPSSGILTISPLAAPDGNQFVITGGTCASGTTNLAPTTACTVIVQFRPTTNGAKTSTLNVAGTAPTSNVSVPLSGTGG